MDYAIVIPVMCEEVSKIFFDSFGKVDLDRVLIIDNSPDGFMRHHAHPYANVVSCPDNMGVARAWNMGIKFMREKGAEILWIVSSGLKFKHGFYEDVLLNGNGKNSEFGLLTNQAWRCIGIGTHTFDVCGKFDENFYPGYYEDNDFLYRMKIAKIHDPSSEIMLPKINVDAEVIEPAHVRTRGLAKINMRELVNYYYFKWGGFPGTETYRHPWNFEEKGISFWERKTIEQLKIQYKL